MFSWFDARDAQQFGETLANFFMERVPANDTGSKAPVSKKQEAVEKMGLQIQVFKVNHKLNLYKKAKLANSFKWKLLDTGYQPDMVDELTRTILIKL
ncbi:MAG: hypothetical protein JO002_12405 [Burkholderiaceae bacterium]|nr:hypothetical protein [Burkholderiaceae bacterium]